MRRRAFIKAGLASTAAAVTHDVLAFPVREELKGNINHSVCKWCYPELTVEQLAVAAAMIGMQSVELLGPKDWGSVQAEGLTCAMVNAPSIEGHAFIEDGFNDPANHVWLIPAYLKLIRQVAEAGLPNLICFSGNRRGLSDQTGLEHCVAGLQEIVPLAEELGVTLCMELLNSRVDHIDYQADHTEWGLKIVDRIGSDRFKLLYDIYHMQIMEGDIIRTIRDHHAYIAHYHTGGNPGRNEIDDSQELNYRAIAEAILETGFTGYIAQEFIPTRTPVTSLLEGVLICDV
jgi:hydroxypyruvate isomerase